MRELIENQIKIQNIEKSINEFYYYQETENDETGRENVEASPRTILNKIDIGNELNVRMKP